MIGGILSTFSTQSLFRLGQLRLRLDHLWMFVGVAKLESEIFDSQLPDLLSARNDRRMIGHTWNRQQGVGIVEMLLDSFVVRLQSCSRRSRHSKLRAEIL